MVQEKVVVDGNGGGALEVQGASYTIRGVSSRRERQRVVRNRFFNGLYHAPWVVNYVVEELKIRVSPSSLSCHKCSAGELQY